MATLMQRWRGNLILVLTATLAALFVAEVGLRAAGISFPTFWQIDRNVGATLRPGAEGWWKREGEAYIRISSAGLRDREHATAKPPNTLRIGVLGDSYAEALQVPLQDAFWSVLERELKACPAVRGRDVEVINFGVSGYGTGQELLTLQHRVWVYDPDVVLLAFTTGNDIRNNSRELEPEKKRPFFVLQKGELVLDVEFSASPWFRLKETPVLRYLYSAWSDSRILQLVHEAQRIAKAKREMPATPILEDRPLATPAKSASDRNTPWDGFAEAGLDAMIYVEPRDLVWKEAWQITEQLLLAMQDEVRKKGAQFLVVTLTNGPQVHPDPTARHEFQRRLSVPHLFYPDYRIRELGERRGFRVLNLAPALQTYAEQHHVYFHGFTPSTLGTGHWNVQGHHLAGQLIAREMCSRLQR